MSPALSVVSDLAAGAARVERLALTVMVLAPAVLFLALLCGGISVFARRVRAARRRGVYLGGRNAL